MGESAVQPVWVVRLVVVAEAPAAAAGAAHSFWNRPVPLERAVRAVGATPSTTGISTMARPRHFSGMN